MESKHRFATRAVGRMGAWIGVTSFFLVFGLLAASSAVAEPGSDGVLLRDGVLIDVRAGTAFVMSAEGGLDALDLSLGQVAWRTEAAAKPLMLDNGRLLAQAEPGLDGTLPIVALDAATSAVVHRADVALPEGVRSTIDDEPFGTFRVQAAPAADGAVIVWTKTTTADVMRGALPGPNEGVAPAGGVSGLADLPRDKGFERRSGAAQVGPQGTVRALAADAVPVTKAGLGAPAALRELPADQRLDLAGRQFVSADGRHVLASERLDEVTPWQSHRWTVADRASGTVLGSVERGAAVAPFVVIGGRLVYVSQPTTVRTAEGWDERPMTLRALDLGSGVEVWDHVVRNTAFAGPFAP